MVLEYLPAKLGHFSGFYVGKYSSTMEHLGMYIYIYIYIDYQPSFLVAAWLHRWFQILIATDRIRFFVGYNIYTYYSISCIYRTWGL